MEPTKVPLIPSNTARIRGIHRYSFRNGEWAEIIGARMVHGRICFMICYNDGFIDYTPIVDIQSYEIDSV